MATLPYISLITKVELQPWLRGLGFKPLVLGFTLTRSGKMRSSRILTKLLHKAVSGFPVGQAIGKASVISRTILDSSCKGHRWIGAYGSKLSFGNLGPQYAVQNASFSSAPAPELGTKDGNTGSSIDNAEPAASEEASEPVCKDKGSEVKAEEDHGPGKDDETVKFKKEIESLKWMLREKDSLVKERDKFIHELKDKLVRNYAETENIRERARREAENTKKFSIQSFAKDLLDVADNLGRAAAAVPENVNSSEVAKDAAALGKLLQTLLEGVRMTESQLLQTFKKFGIEKFNPIGEPFDPNNHLAVCEIDEPTKEAGSVAVVFKNGYTLHERVIRPAEVAVAKEQPDAAASKPDIEADNTTSENKGP